LAGNDWEERKNGLHLIEKRSLVFGVEMREGQLDRIGWHGVGYRKGQTLSFGIVKIRKDSMRNDTLL